MPKFLKYPHTISGTGKATNFIFCTHIHSIDGNKSPLEISDKVGVDVVRDSRNFLGHLYAYMAVAQLSCSFCFINISRMNGSVMLCSRRPRSSDTGSETMWYDLSIFRKVTEASQCNQAEWERVISNKYPYIKPTWRCCPQYAVTLIYRSSLSVWNIHGL